MINLLSLFANLSPKKKWFYLLFLFGCINLKSQTDTIRIKELLKNIKEKYRNEPKEADAYLDTVIPLLKENIRSKKEPQKFYISKLIKCFRVKGIIAHVQYKNDDALNSYLKGLRLSELFNEREEYLTFLNQISTLYVDLRLYGFAEQYLVKAIPLEEELLAKNKNDQSSILRVSNEYNNLAGIYYVKKKYPEAQKYYKSCLKFKISEDLEPDRYYIYYNLATSFIETNNADSAKKYLEITSLLSKKANDGIACHKIYYFSLAYIEYLNKNYKKAINYFKQKSVLDSKEENYLDINAYEGIVKAAHELKDYPTEALYLSKIKVFNEKVILETLGNFEIENERKYNTNQKQNEINDLIVQKNKFEFDALIDKNNKKYLTYITLLFALLIIILIYVAFILIKRNKSQKTVNSILYANNTELQEKAELIKEQSIEITRHQSQMNPHFIFNSLSGIQSMVINNENDKALSQLIDFSTLMRITLANSEKDLILLDNELAFLTQYIEFELKRFKKKFAYELFIDEKLDLKNTLIPPMLIQPFIENAIKHGGLNNTENGKLTINFKIIGENCLEVIVEDNGKGLKNGSGLQSAGVHAMNITKKRLNLLQEKYKVDCGNLLEIINASDTDKNRSGVSIIIRLPYLKNF